ncbi:tripartite tricarboxylate transporter TctB family protein [Biomaibacter acetigenes]|jgi:hypothetical protein|uniref:Tripartite tricarboxylate transporter TctB family protein n=1 Tax=Biomaibacter acetigenes TaxID=2316383 RepID=A0A3G2R2N6_9FIRM|nr:tripartite tricarboxylate transporter TctB family protein [Biomaibacter acetigenes]AYO29642.1 tripartite tricarboxylate transporter TctB family protein [Biomaibacter acetigenes]RKL63619.1 tripartite tricarboxylate transporter TctB family protein [Thermoanaerobacteraceae bacterium SP2]
MVNGDVVLGVFTAILSIFWITQSLKFPGGTADGVPGAGYFPILVASLLLVLSIILIYQGFKNKNVYFDIKHWSNDTKKMLVMTIVVIAVFFALWYFTTYIIACLVLTFGLGYAYKLSIKNNIILSILFSFGTYYVFNNLLQVMLKLR